MNNPSTDLHPHRGSPVLRLGSELETARSALILVHGRGASAEDMVGLAEAFSLPDGMVVLAPQAAGNIWYPQRLTAPIESNEPYLSSALRRVNELVEMLGQKGIPHEKIIIGGFSQGASLSIEALLRSGHRWGGLLAFSGGHIWPEDQPRQAVGTALDGTPAFLGCSNVDPFIPQERFEESAALLAAQGAQVAKHIYPGMGHTIIQAEIDSAQSIINSIG
jgi:predicted esterase